MLPRVLAFWLFVLAIPADCRPQDPPEYSAAVDLIRQQRWEAALSCIRELEQTYPENPKVGNLKGLALLGKGDTDAAAAAFERVLHARPGFFPAWKNLVVLEWAANKPGAARRTEEALKVNPRDPVLNSYAALSELQRNETERVDGHLDLAGNAISAMPPQIETSLAYELGTHGLYSRAVLVFQDLVQRGGGPTTLYNLGLAQYLAGQYDGAIQSLQELASLERTSDALNLLAEAYEKSNETQRAIDKLREAIALDPADEANYLDLAAICVEHNAYPLGIEVVNIGLTNRPGSERLLFQLGLLHALSENFDQARVEFERAAQLAPASDLPVAAMELANIRQSRLGDAIEDLRRKVKEQPQGAMLWYLLGKATMLNGAQSGSPEFDEALAAFQNAIRFDPKLPYSYAELGKMYMQLGLTAEAVSVLEKSIVLAPAKQSSYYQLALAYRKLNRPQEAGEMLVKLKELNRHERQFQPSGLVER